MRGDVAEEVQKLKQQAGQNVLIYGSGELVNTLMQHHLIDTYRVMVYPLGLGIGKRLFTSGGEKIRLTLTSAETTSMGVVVLTYQPAGQESEASARGKE
jgi:dihydrofolate reductase